MTESANSKPPVLVATVVDTEDARASGSSIASCSGSSIETGTSRHPPASRTRRARRVAVLRATGTAKDRAVVPADQAFAPGDLAEGPTPQMLHLDTRVPTVEDLFIQRQRALDLGASELYDRSEDPEEPLHHRHHGQDGSYLAELLLAKGYEVHGLIRRASTFNTAGSTTSTSTRTTRRELFLHYGDLTDGRGFVTLLHEIKPDEVYNLGAQSHVRVSFDEPEHTGDTDGLGTIRMLEAVRMAGLETRFYQASSSRCTADTAAPERGDAVLPALALRLPPRSTPTGSPRTTARPTACSRSTASCSTTSPPGAARPSSPARSPAPSPRSSRPAGRCLPGQPRRGARLGLRAGVRRGHVADAAGREPDDYVLATGGGTVREFSRAFVRTPGSTGRSTSDSTSATCAPPRSTPSSATPPRPTASSAGRRPSTAASWPAHGRCRHRGLLARRHTPDRPEACGAGRPLGSVGTVTRLPTRGRPRRDLLRRGPSRPRRLARSGASSRPRASRPGRPDLAELDLKDRDAVVRVLRRDQAAVRRARSREGRRHPRQQHLPGRLPQREPADPGQRDGCCAGAGGRAGAVPRVLLHLPEARPQPIGEDSLLTGHLEPTNDAYAIAKIAGILQVQAVRHQYGLAVDLGHADQPLRAQRQLLTDRFARPAGADPTLRRGGPLGSKASPTGGPAHRDGSSCTPTTWPMRACICSSTTTARPGQRGHRPRPHHPRDRRPSPTSSATGAGPSGTPRSPTGRRRSCSTCRSWRRPAGRRRSVFRTDSSARWRGTGSTSAVCAARVTATG